MLCFIIFLYMTAAGDSPQKGTNTRVLVPNSPRTILRQKHPDLAGSLIMKPMTTETKPDVSTITVQTAPEPKRLEEIKEKRKRLGIIAISVVVLVVIVTAAITTAFYIAGKQAENNIKTALLTYKDESGHTSTQKVTVTSREEKFEITGTGTAVFDFDKSLLVYRYENMSKPTCYLTAINSSKLLSPEKMKTFFGDKMTIDVPSRPSEQSDFMSTDIVVPNKDFLSPLSKEMCKDTDLIWMVPKPGCVDGETPTRKKRATCTVTLLYCDYYLISGRIWRICYYWIRCP